MIKESIKDVDELKQLIKESPVAFPNKTIIHTQDGPFIVMNNKPIRMKKTDLFDPKTLVLPEIGYTPTTDRAILMEVSRQDQYTKEGMLAPGTTTVQVRGDNGLITKRVDKKRFFIVKCGKQFAEVSTGGECILERGDEVILAHHLDGLQSFPVIEDPTDIEINTCISLHYTEIVGYRKWSRPTIIEDSTNEIAYLRGNECIWRTNLKESTVKADRIELAKSAGKDALKGVTRVLVYHKGEIRLDSAKKDHKSLLTEIAELI